MKHGQDLSAMTIAQITVYKSRVYAADNHYTARWVEIDRINAEIEKRESKK